MYGRSPVSLSDCRQVATYVGTLSDVDFSTAEIGSLSQLKESAEFWFGADRRSILPEALFINVTCTESTRQGGLVLAEEHMKIAAFVYKLSECIQSGDTAAKGLTELACKVVFGVSRMATSEASNHSVILRMIQCGEDAAQVALESGNFLPFLLASRLVRQDLNIRACDRVASSSYQLKPLIRLKAALKAEGRKHTQDAVFEELKAIKWSAEDSSVHGLLLRQQDQESS